MSKALILKAILLSVFIVTNVYFAVDIPFWDQFDYVDTMILNLKEGISVSKLFEFHQEHRLVIPRLVMYALAKITSWDIRYEIYFNILCGVVIFILVNYLYKFSNHISNKYLNYTYIFILSILVLSFMQYQNWLNGWQLQIFLNIIIVLCIYAVYTSNIKPIWKFSFIIILYILASLNFGNGVFALLPIIFVLSLISVKEFKIRRDIIFFIVLFLVVILMYFHGYKVSHGQSSLTFPWSNPVLFFTSLFFALGSSIFAQYSVLAAIIGVLGVVSYLYYLWKDIQNKNIDVPLLMSLYCFMSLLLIVLGRSSLGDGYAMHSRYATIYNFIWLYIILRLAKESKYISFSSYGVIVVFLIISNIKTFKESSKLYHDKLISREKMVLDTCPERSITDVVHSDDKLVCESLEKLKESKLSMYRTIK